LNQAQLLVVEDEPELASLLGDYLQAAGFAVHIIYDGLEVVPWVKANQPQLVLLDLMLPGRDGLDICKDLRSFSDVPIMMLTARVEEIDRLLGLELGADDYICKPYSPREVVARTKVILRRLQLQSSPLIEQPLILDVKSMKAIVKGFDVGLTVVEFQLLAMLHREPGRIFSREQIMTGIYDDYRVVSDRTIDSHVKKVRKKIQAALPDDEIIYSVYGAGYKFEPLA